MDNVANLSIAYFLSALLFVQMRCTLSVLLILLREGRRHRRMLMECSSAATAVMLHFAPRTSRYRECWMRVRSKDWWERVVLKEFTDAEWREHFRMSRRSFDKLCGLMEQTLSPQDVTVRAPIPLQMRVAIALFKLSNCAEYRVIANQFGVHKSTVKKFVYSFCKGMVSSVIHSLIQAPAAEEARAIARRFEQKFSIPQIVGCIDSTHIPVLPPRDGYKDFMNRNGWPSYVLQAVVDDTYRFWNINCKMPGCAHDASVLRQSVLFDQAQLLPKEPRELSGVSVNLFILGNQAYPLLDWLMKSYADSPHVTPQQESFNDCLRSARTTMEIAFSRLKSRWKVLIKKSDFHYTFTPSVIATCCALHNFCENEKEMVSPSWTEEAAALEHGLPQPGVRSYSGSDSSDGQKIRLALTDYLQANAPLRKSVF
ncbi:protein ALP1-like [Salarias fasciatus]|uniref:protein ALP1-like n=1 Tax=Salarias fasciatus TaxID=181472 RepID=UPI0011768C4E|nr:protein ALP1-like [Salarias fasciatus]